MARARTSGASRARSQSPRKRGGARTPPDPVVNGRPTADPPPLVLVPFADIDLEDRTFQYRLETRSEDLRPSLERDGQQEPVDLIGPKPHRIVDGFRRIDALRALRTPGVMALVHERLTEDEAHTIAFVKNVVRRNLTPIEKGNAIRVALRRGKNRKTIAQSLGLSERQVERYEALVRFPEPIQQLVETGKASMLTASVLAAFDPPDPGAWALRAFKNRWSAKELRRQLQRALGARQPGRKRQIAKVEGDKLQVYAFRIGKDAPESERERAIEGLERALEFLRGGRG